MDEGWSILLSQARAARGRLPYALRAYSEFMPPPYVGVKPYGEPDPFTVPEGDDHGWNISEYEWAQELRPGIERIATHVLDQIVKLARGQTSQVSARLLAENPAWPAALANRVAWPAEETFPLILPIALTKTQDDKGRVRWTLLGSSGALLPSEPFWASFRGRRGNERPDAAKRLDELLAWLLQGDPSVVRFLPHEGTALPAFVASRAYREDEPLDGVATLVTFVAFADLPARVQWAYLEGRLRIVPFPASMVFREHPGYRKLGAAEVPLLHLFPRSGVNDAIRIPQSGWLDEVPHESETHRARRLHRTHRWQRVARHEDDAPQGGLDDSVTLALFSTGADDIALYGKPMARNCHIWTEDYDLVLEGPFAGREEIERAAATCRAGGRFGYRMHYPPMRIGECSGFLYLPVVARWEEGHGARVWPGPLPGLLLAGSDAGEVELRPRLLQRPAQLDSIDLFGHDPAERRQTGNCRRLLEWRELLRRPLTPAFARALLDASKEEDLQEWLAKLPSRASDPARAAGLVTALRGLLGADEDPGAPITLEATRTREFEERYWRTIASLAEGTFRDKNNADAVTLNAGRTGGKPADEAHRKAAKGRDLEALRDHLHAHYAELFTRHGMAGRAACADHVFRWETDFDFPWMGGWARNAKGEPCEANVVVVIPGRNRAEAVIMADHYDTAYMEDVYDPARGGDKLRAAAAGADDNHSATAALMLAADVLLPLAREGKLARDVWLVHLTGEEFPADCLGARALASALLERKLVLDGGVDLSATRVTGVYILDMVAHNREKDLDVFQIAPGEGRGSARLAWIASRANQRWNRAAKEWNRGEDRHGHGRSKRMPDGSTPPPIAEHALLQGEVRPEWDPRSALYNTDGQIFSDLGVPVVLFMENYDIRRSGYHDTQDTMANIDLDYGAALVAIAIESVAEAALTLPKGTP